MAIRWMQLCNVPVHYPALCVFVCVFVRAATHSDFRCVALLLSRVHPLGTGPLLPLIVIVNV